MAESAQGAPAPANDANCIATIKPYRSLVSLGSRGGTAAPVRDRERYPSPIRCR